MKELTWKVGFEIELLAPQGRNRKDLADAIALKAGGYSKRCFYPQSEPSVVPGTPVFENLTLGFDVYDSDNRLVVKCVDDLTIRRNLDRAAVGLEDWYRILSDDGRLLRLIVAQCDPSAHKEFVLAPIAGLFGTKLVNEDEIVRVDDALGSPIALAASLPGERERPCELITPPIESHHLSRLVYLLEAAAGLAFVVPHEAAVHLHFDAGKLCDTPVFCRLIRVLDTYGNQLRRAVGTNANCTRLGPLPRALRRMVREGRFCGLNWEEAANIIKKQGLKKYCDFNVMNFVHRLPDKPTFEVRILPGTLDATQIIEQSMLFQSILDWCVNEQTQPRLPGNLSRFLQLIE